MCSEKYPFSGIVQTFVSTELCKTTNETKERVHEKRFTAYCIVRTALCCGTFRGRIPWVCDPFFFWHLRHQRLLCVIRNVAIYNALSKQAFEDTENGIGIRRVFEGKIETARRLKN